MKADVYRNLNKDGKFSVRSRETDNYGKVVGHYEIIKMEDCEYVVQDSGYERCQEEGQKNVHAFVRGKVVEADNFIKREIGENLFEDIFGRERVFYNPYVHDYFYDKSGSEVSHSDDAILIIDRVFAKNPVTN